MDETAPGYRHVFIDPQIPEGVTWAKMTKDTPYGVIAVDWELTDNIMTLQVDIPAGVTATLCIPDGAVACKMNGVTAFHSQNLTFHSTCLIYFPLLSKGRSNQTHR